MSADNDTAGAAPAQDSPVPKPVLVNVPPRVLEILKHFEREYAVYRRELPRLLDEGEAGRYALVKGDQLLSVWDTSGDAIQAGYQRFGLDDPFVVQKISPRDLQLFAMLDARKEAQCR
jgi:hypothetical protein